MVRIEDRKFILFHSNYFDMVPLLGQTPVLYLSRVSTKLWNESYNPKENHPYIFDVVGSIKYFHELSSTLILKKPINSHLLEILYKGQEERLRAMADDIMGIQQLTHDDRQCQCPITTRFEDDMPSTILHINFPKDQSVILNQFKTGNVVKITCELAYNQKQKSLHLTAETIDIIHAVEIIIT